MHSPVSKMCLASNLNGANKILITDISHAPKEVEDEWPPQPPNLRALDHYLPQVVLSETREKEAHSRPNI
eukprot:2129225-Amphidinium_carterae.1